MFVTIEPAGGRSELGTFGRKERRRATGDVVKDGSEGGAGLKELRVNKGAGLEWVCSDFPARVQVPRWDLVLDRQIGGGRLCVPSSLLAEADHPAAFDHEGNDFFAKALHLLTGFGSQEAEKLLKVEEVDVRIKEGGGNADMRMRPQEGHAKMQVGRIDVGNVIGILEEKKLVCGAVVGAI